MRSLKKPSSVAWGFPLPGALVLALILAGCSQANSTRLPELNTIPRKVLSGEEQQKVVEDLQKHRETHQAEAIKDIRSASRGN